MSICISRQPKGLVTELKHSVINQYSELPDGDTTHWGTAPYGRPLLPHMQARLTDTYRFRGDFSGDNRFTRPIVEDFLRGKHQAFTEDKSGSEKSPRTLFSTCSGRKSSGRRGCPYGAVPQCVVSPSGGSYLPPVMTAASCHWKILPRWLLRIFPAGQIPGGSFSLPP